MELKRNVVSRIALGYVALPVILFLLGWLRPYVGIPAVVTVSLGATLVERHFTLGRALGGADAAFSTTPAEFKAMVDAIRLRGTGMREEFAI